jgi:hypothetical protein
MSDLENPNQGILSSDAETAQGPVVETNSTATSLHFPSMTEQESAEVAVERQRLQSMFMEFLNSSFSIGDDDDDGDDNVDNDGNNNQQRPSRYAPCCICFREKLHRLLNIIAYPFIVLFTIIGIVMIVTFCILPALFCLTLGICAYYCFIEDPMSLHMLFRYMFSPDNAAEAAFANGNGSSLYPMTQNRSLVQSKLIVRRLMKVSNSSDRNGEDVNEDATKKYPRRHPSSILIWTESKCLQFSAPLVFDDESTEDEDADKKTKKKKLKRRRRRTEDISPSSGEGEGDDEIEGESGGTYDQRSGQRGRSNRNIQESMPDDVTLERDGGEAEMIVEIPSRDGSEAPVALEEEEIDIDEEMGTVPISVGHDEDDAGEEKEGENVEVSTSPTGTMELPTGDESNDEREEMNVPDVPVCQDCNDTFSETHQISLDARDLSNPLEVDYFGIESDVRDRNTACDICLLEYEIGDEVAWSPNLACSHTYHKDCVLDW